MTGKQVVEVPASSIGGYENVIAVCHRGVEIQKVRYLSVNVLQSAIEEVSMYTFRTSRWSPADYATSNDSMVPEGFLLFWRTMV